MEDAWGTVEEITGWLDAGSDLPPDTEKLLRIMKLTEEAGEVTQAVIGVMGANPRKGITHTWDDVHAELCDVMLTTMVALATLTLGARTVFDAHLARVARRSLGPGHDPAMLEASSGLREWVIEVSPLRGLVTSRREQVLDIAARHHADRVCLFGSVARGDDHPDSDIDFLVDFSQDSSLFDLIRMAGELEELLGHRVDVVSTGGLKERDQHILGESIDL